MQNLKKFITKTSQKNVDRRQFFKFSLVAGATILFGSFFRRNENQAFAADLPMLEVTDPIAASLGYNPNAAKVDTKKWTKKGEAEGKAQRCNTCMLYTSIDKNKGKCQIFANNLVSSSGWCNSWSKKS